MPFATAAFRYSADAGGLPPCTLVLTTVGMPLYKVLGGPLRLSDAADMQHVCCDLHLIGPRSCRRECDNHRTGCGDIWLRASC